MKEKIEEALKYAIRTQLSTFDLDEIQEQMNEDFILLTSNSDSINFIYDEEKGIRFFDPYNQLHCTKHLHKDHNGWTLWTNE